MLHKSCHFSRKIIAKRHENCWNIGIYDKPTHRLSLGKKIKIVHHRKKKLCPKKTLKPFEFANTNFWTMEITENRWKINLFFNPEQSLTMEPKISIWYRPISNAETWAIINNQLTSCIWPNIDKTTNLYEAVENWSNNCSWEIEPSGKQKETKASSSLD